MLHIEPTNIKMYLDGVEFEAHVIDEERADKSPRHPGTYTVVLVGCGVTSFAKAAGLLGSRVAKVKSVTCKNRPSKHSWHARTHGRWS